AARQPYASQPAVQGYQQQQSYGPADASAQYGAQQAHQHLQQMQQQQQQQQGYGQQAQYGYGQQQQQPVIVGPQPGNLGDSGASASVAGLSTAAALQPKPAGSKKGAVVGVVLALAAAGTGAFFFLRAR